MKKRFSSSQALRELPLWGILNAKRSLYSFEMDLTARCNLNCRHCFINLPAGDRKAKEAELPLPEIERIATEAVSLGALWCLLSGGEPLLRQDFFDIFMALKKKGLLVSVFTNGTLITPEHVRFFKKFPPREMEMTVYGTTRETYETVTRKRGSFMAFQKGLDRLRTAGIPVHLKAMALRSNLHEMPAIIRFCEENGAGSFRFDPFLHLRYDGDPARNREIVSERLSPQEVVALEMSYPPRFKALREKCRTLPPPATCSTTESRIFRCRAGEGSFCVSYDGLFRPCSSLWHPDSLSDLKKGSVAEAWHRLAAKLGGMRSTRRDFIEKCHACPIVDLCMWCPAVAYLESGELDAPADFFCELAKARADAFRTVDIGDK